MNKEQLAYLKARTIGAKDTGVMLVVAPETVAEAIEEIERLTTGINGLVKRWRDYANEPAASKVGRIVAGDCADELAMLVAE